ncbi:MAG: Fpg/Nei family DNA glycosylase [Candidatus Dormibacteria bacterium]
MPELPEVEALTRFIDSQLRGRTVVRAELASFSALKSAGPTVASLVGQELQGAGRRGKFLCLQFQGTWLVVHLARAGWLRWYPKLPEARARPTRSPVALRLGFGSGPSSEPAGFDLTEAGTQKRLALWLVPDPAQIPAVSALGPDPLDPGLDARRLGQRLAGFPGSIKMALTSQALLAGVGNAYSDEALHWARLSPFKPAAGLSAQEVERLHTGLVRLLADAVARAEGVPAAELKDAKRQVMRVHGRTGLACPVCGDVVRQVSFSSKSLQYCATCQTGGKPLADRRLSRLLR